MRQLTEQLVDRAPLTVRLGRDWAGQYPGHPGATRHLPSEDRSRRACACPGPMDRVGCSLDATAEDLLCDPCREFCWCLDDDGNNVRLLTAALRGII